MKFSPSLRFKHVPQSPNTVVEKLGSIEDADAISTNMSFNYPNKACLPHMQSTPATMSRIKEVQKVYHQVSKVKPLTEAKVFSQINTNSRSNFSINLKALGSQDMPSTSKN